MLFGVDLNAHHTLWGSEKSDNGQVIEEVLNGGNLVCLNAGNKIRVNVRTGKESGDTGKCWT